MCGIAGRFTSEAVIPAEDGLGHMIATLRHRGPDHARIHSEQHFGVAHARLSIVDLSDRSNQPMTDIAGSCVIALNGEIYNYKELRNELKTRGHRFATESDTEVILEAYKEWGDAFLDRLNGMWAFALWDRGRKRLLLSRDRFGVKPLFVHFTAGGLLFASEIKALLVAGVPREVDVRTLNAILSFAGGDRERFSMFRGIEALPAGECLAITPGQPPKRWRWWTTADRLVEVPARYKQRVERFRELLFDSVRLRLRTDVPTAISLSSGLDSSSIYAVWHELLGRGEARSATADDAVRLIPFVAAFPGYAIDESAEATALARYFGDEPECIRVTPESFRERVEEVTWHQESLVWSAAVIAYHELYRAMSQRGIRVVLEGHGSDELLGGYPQFPRLLVGNALRNLAPWTAWQGAVAFSRAQGPMHDRPAVSPFEMLTSIFKQRLAGAKSDGRPHLFDADFLGTPEVLTPPQEAKNFTPLKQSLYMAFHARVLPAILRVFDRAAMAHAVESRSPFLDWRLVTYAFSLPDSDLIGKGWTKRIQRDAMRGMLPADTLWRKRKIGFALPHPEWFATPSVSGALREAVTDGLIDRAPGLRRSSYINLLEKGQSEGFTWRTSGAIWQAYSYALWYDRFFGPLPAQFQPEKQVLDSIQADS